MNELTEVFPRKIKNTVLIPKGPRVDQEAVSLLFRAVFFKADICIWVSLMFYIYIICNFNNPLLEIPK